MSRLRVLHVEDSERDFALVKRHLSRANYDVASIRVETASAMAAVLPSINGMWFSAITQCPNLMPWQH